MPPFLNQNFAANDNIPTASIIAEDSVVADSAKSNGKNVLTETADEFKSIEGDGLDFE